MPTYEYHCAKCDKTFDLYQSMSDATLTVCPPAACNQRKWGKGKVKRVIGTGAGLIFKGSGFYITDYRSENYKAGAKQDAPPASPASTETKSTSDAKPAAPKKETKSPKPAAAKD